MYGDFSRDSFRPEKQFRRVLMQQGRVLLDADFNDQVAILLENQAAAIRTLLASYGTDEPSFKVTITANPGGLPPVGVAPGHYYVDGLLCRYDKERVPIDPFPDDHKNKRYLLYLAAWEQGLSASEDTRGDFREPALNGMDTALRTEVRCRICTEEIGSDLFRDVKAEKACSLSEEIKQCATTKAIDAGAWKQNLHVMSEWWPFLGSLVMLLSIIAGVLALSAESPPAWWALATILALLFVAVALLTLDSLVRSIVRLHEEQRKLLVDKYNEFVDKYNKLVGTAAVLLTEPLRQQEVTNNFRKHFEQFITDKHTGPGASANLELRDSRKPNAIPPMYYGSRCLLYRVEVHHVGSAGQVWLKWSRDNGAHLYEVKPAGSAETSSLTIEDPQAEGEGLKDRWVELLPADHADAAPSPLRKVTDARWDAKTRAATLTLDRPAPAPTYIRAWDHPGAAAGDASLPQYGAIKASSGWQTLEQGLELQLSHADYKPGDYWQIKVRPGQPLKSPLQAQCRQEHHAPLALVEFDGAGTPTVIDCRILIAPTGRLSDETITQLSPRG